MFTTIVRILVISYLTYLVLNEVGMHTAITVYLIMMVNEFTKWNMRDMHNHHRSELRAMEDSISEARRYTRLELIKLNAKLNERIEYLELIIGPIKGGRHDK